MSTVPKPLLEGLQVTYVEAYTVSGADITSAYLGKTLNYAFFQTSEDCTITVTCLGGNSQAIIIKGGIPYPYAVKKITAISAGLVYILHNGY